jgi:hypothetical protein
MKRRLVRNFGVALLAAASVYAQGSSKLTVQIPFGFHVGATLMPSGEYTVDTDTAAGVVRMRSADSKSAVMILSNAVEAKNTPERGKLIFTRYGEEYFLSQVWRPGMNTGRELRKSHREMEVAATARRGLESVIATNR